MIDLICDILMNRHVDNIFFCNSVIPIVIYAFKEK